MLLKDRIPEDMRSAMRAGDKARLGAVRLILAAVRQVEVDSGQPADDAVVIEILAKMRKQRLDSYEQFEAAGRQDLADQEASELAIIGSYMPEPVSAEELARLIDHTIVSVGAVGIRDMGKVMASIKPTLQGRADMGQVSATIKSRLSVV